jgi:hypothetical protein
MTGEHKPPKAPDSATVSPQPEDDGAPLLASDVRFQLAVEALLTENTLVAAAERVGVSARTLRRWLHEKPEFAAAVREGRRAALAQAGTQLVSATSKATEALLDVLDETEAPAAARVGAARAILEHAARFVEVDDIGERLRELEALVRERSSRT